MIYFTVVIVNLEKTEYEINEAAFAMVEVCALMSVNCVPFEFEVLLSTHSGTASMF